MYRYKGFVRVSDTQCSNSVRKSLFSEIKSKIMETRSSIRRAAKLVVTYAEPEEFEDKTSDSKIGAEDICEEQCENSSEENISSENKEEEDTNEEDFAPWSKRGRPSYLHSKSGYIRKRLLN
ncbi:uncharacterized protein LOC116852508 [Odontomachus brunneus]|uniref:uncharacterized protein LOC116852508 n=1 Tax=Odontomachus brunneus TaxID=486640 RepID=UPI0013F2207F|nr:uncharacterized protein LOC116852508 [Odontomachus brunneus]